MANPNVDSYWQVYILLSSSGRLRHSYTPALACRTFRLESGSASIVNFQFVTILPLAIKKGGETTTAKLLSIIHRLSICLGDAYLTNIQFFVFNPIIMAHKKSNQTCSPKSATPNANC